MCFAFAPASARGPRRSRGWAGALALLAAALLAPARHAAGADDPKDKPLPPEEVTLRTADDVTIAATFYASKLGRKAVPVILLHAAKGNRGDFEPLALLLQRAGHAVMAVDLRGHGDSPRPGGRVGDLRPADYEAIVEPGGDLETVKKFLLAKNNAGELNIEKLCVVGIELGAVVALNWAARDWSWPLLATGKQGQDVKALVLVSPEWSYKGLRINEAVAQPNVRADLSVMIVVGKGNNKLLKEARRLHSAFEKYHAASSSGPESETLWFKTPQTNLQAARLVNDKTLHVDEMIVKFIESRLVKQQIPWADRSSRLP